MSKNINQFNLSHVGRIYLLELIRRLSSQLKYSKVNAPAQSMYWRTEMKNACRIYKLNEHFIENNTF